MQPSKSVLRQITSKQIWWSQHLSMTGIRFVRTSRLLHYPTLSSPSHVHLKPSILRLLQPAIRFSSSSQSSQPTNDSGSHFFCHTVQPPTPISMSSPACALSFSPETPPSSLSKTIIGWFPIREGASGTTSSPVSRLISTEGTILAGFVPNSAFVEVLQSVIKDGLREGVDEIQRAMAMQTIHGWMHIHDQRNIPALNRIGDPDDIIGTVLVEDSEIRPETYQPMPSYRLVTSDGPIQLTPGLAEKLQTILSKIAKVEKASLS